MAAWLSWLWLAPEAMEVRRPKKATFRRYGLSPKEWQAILDSQGGACFICQRVPKTGRLCVDHEHAPGWEKMPAEKRKLFVRGLLCWVCNSYYAARGITVAKAARLTEYLKLYEQRKTNVKERQAA